MRTIWCLTMFADFFDRFVDRGVIGASFRQERAREISLQFKTVAIADHAAKGFKGVDDSPYGGGQGMIMRADVLKSALINGVVAAGGYQSVEDLHVVCPAPRGKVWDQAYAQAFAQNYFSIDASKDLVFICGRYEGIDERFLSQYVNEFISVGDFILTGGELAVMTILDSALRLSPGVLGNDLSAIEESFSNGRLEHALYTRPYEFEGLVVPSALKNGHHKEIDEFKLSSSLEMTEKYRPDLLKK
jgi:tRNA (guanine37-N1)-methyltransferase